MQRTRSLRSQQKSKCVSGDAGDKRESSTSGEDQQKIILLPKYLLKTAQELTLALFRDPTNGNGMQCLVDEHSGKYLQLIQFKNSPSSYFIDDNVQQDGSLTFATEIDPIFLILPYLTLSDKYQPLDQILVDDEFKDCSLLNTEQIHQKILAVAKIKETNEFKVYCFDWNKCREWLLAKLMVLIDELKNEKINVNSMGAQAVTFIRKNNENCSEDEYKRYAHGILTEFLPPDISVKLFNHLSLESIEETISPQPPAKKPKLESALQEPTEDYFVKKPVNQRDNEKTKLTASQKALQKVDKTGMKSISSFFKKV